MPYDRLIDGLADRPRAAVAALPDGSVDVFSHVLDGRGTRVETKADFAERIASGASDSFRRRRLSVEPGGQAVNTARQLGRLPGTTTLYGHLDHPVFADLDVEQVSMGEPQRVDVVRFDRGSITVADPSEELEGWTPADLREGHPGSWEALLSTDAVCCENWVTVPGVADLLTLLAAADYDGVVVVDPGPITGTRPADLWDLLDAVAAVAEVTTVAVSVDRSELDHLTTALEVAADGVGRPDGPAADGGPGPSTDAARVAAVRESIDGGTLVLHDAARSVAATPFGTTTVENLRAAEVRRESGAGDRFTAGLAYGLGVGWDPELALALGNACGAHFVERGETGDPESLREYVRERAEGV